MEIKIPKKQELKESITIILDDQNYRYQLTKDLVYKFGGTFVIVVPEGFKFDGDSNPISLSKSEIDYKKLVATLLHDYGYQVQFLVKKVWDAMLFAILKETKGILTAIWYYIGVTVFGWIPWFKNKKHLQKFPQAKETFYKVICYEKEN